MQKIISVILFFLAAASWSQAQDANEVEKKQAEFAKTAAERAGMARAATFEADAFRFTGDMSKERALSLAKILSKQTAVASKLVKFTGDEKPWEGKLNIFLFQDRLIYSGFVRNQEERRPETEEKWTVNSKGATPYIAVVVSSFKPAELEAKLVDQIGEIVLERKVGGVSKFPDWFKEGFGKLVALKSSPETYLAFRNGNKAKVGPKGAWYYATLKHINGEFAANEKIDPKELSRMRTAFVDYLLNLPDGKSDVALGNFRVSEETPMPSIAGLSALVEVKEGEDWSKKLEVDWKTWVSGKEPKKEAKPKDKDK